MATQILITPMTNDTKFVMSRGAQNAVRPGLGIQRHSSALAARPILVATSGPARRMHVLSQVLMCAHVCSCGRPSLSGGAASGAAACMYSGAQRGRSVDGRMAVVMVVTNEWTGFTTACYGCAQNKKKKGKNYIRSDITPDPGGHRPQGIVPAHRKACSFNLLTIVIHGEKVEQPVHGLGTMTSS